MPAAAPLLMNAAINIGIAVGASVLSNLISPKTSTAKPGQRQMSFDLTVGENVPVSTVFGRGRVEGHLIFGQEYGKDNSYAKFVFELGKGHFDALEGVLVDDVVTTLSGSNSDMHGYVVDRFKVNSDNEPAANGTPYMWVKFYNGAPGQTADAGLIMAAPTRWTVNHKLSHTAYVVVTIRQNADLFGSSLPRLSYVVRGMKLYDWRYDSTMPGGSGSQRWNDPTTWAWTENPAVIKYNFRRGIWLNGIRVLGMGMSHHAQDMTYYTAAANARFVRQHNAQV